MVHTQGCPLIKFNQLLCFVSVFFICDDVHNPAPPPLPNKKMQYFLLLHTGIHTAHLTHQILVNRLIVM